MFKEQVREVLASVDVLTVLADLGLTPLEYGNPHMCHCPFHGDAGRPNMALYPYPSKSYSAAHYYCFACEERGDMLELACKQLGCTKREGLDFLAGRRTYGPIAPAPTRSKVANKNYLDFAKRCHERLMSSAGLLAREYLLSRCLYEVAEQYMLGFTSRSDNAWSERLTIPFIQSFEDAPVNMMKARTLQHFREGRGFDKVLDGNKYLNTANSTLEPYLYHIGMEMTQHSADTLVIVEGEMDALTSVAILPHPYVIAMPGVRALKAEWLTKMSGLDAVVILDADECSDRTRVKYTTLLEEAGVYVHHAYLPLDAQSTDLNEFYVQDNSAAIEWLIGEMTAGEKRSLLWY